MKRTLSIATVIAGIFYLSSPACGQQLTSAMPPDNDLSELDTAVSENKDTRSTFAISGSIDTYFHTTFGRTNDYTDGASAPATAFADLKGFGLGMANVVASYSHGAVGFTADLAFGPRGRAAAFTSPQGIINQMYAFYKMSEKVTLKLGQFNTFLGYEVISPASNFHYSTSYMFSYGPFSHTGLSADIDLGHGLNAKIAVMNPSDLVEFNPVDTYTLGVQLGHSNSDGGVWLNFLYGDQDGNLRPEDDPYVRDDNGAPIGLASSSGALFQADLTAGWNLSEKYYLGLNTSWQSVGAGESFSEEGELRDFDAEAASFFGVALYPRVSLSTSSDLGLRAEYLAVTHGHLGIFPVDHRGRGSVMEYTLSGNYTVANLVIIPELRVDMASDDSFRDANGKPTSSLPSFNLAAVYKF